ncbi:hypothetical protein CCR75_007368 [Bremia lactucae]|uniref:RxLR effector protein n=1 Tax=Bremia lactucae TaxID=4779 RepID=A0A976FG22_BRELC|nr:hypothetical protein CCR75_007368 [Bremia lactucae]
MIVPLKLVLAAVVAGYASGEQEPLPVEGRREAINYNDEATTTILPIHHNISTITDPALLTGLGPVVRGGQGPTLNNPEETEFKTTSLVINHNALKDTDPNIFRGLGPRQRIGLEPSLAPCQPLPVPAY